LLSCATVARRCTTVIVRGMGPEEEERESPRIGRQRR